MTVQFDIVGHHWPVDRDGCQLPPAAMFLNIANSNSYDFFRWLDIDPGQCSGGDMPARELAALLRRRLWPERRARGDEGVPASVAPQRAGPTIIQCGREPGRLCAYAERLLALAEFAGDGVVHWY